MPSKFLKIIYAFLISTLPLFGCAAQPDVDAWSTSNLGKCYTTLDDLMSNNFWEGYEDDENIKKYKLNVTSKSINYIWINDTTPKINITNNLISIDKSGKACIILHAPLSSSISLTLDSNGQLPSQATSVNTPPPGFPATKITYQRDDDGIYHPKSCSRIIGSKEKPIECKDAFID